MNNFKPNGIILSVKDIRGLSDEDIQPKQNDRVYVSRYLDINGKKFAFCTNFTRKMKTFGIPADDLNKISYVPIHKYEYKIKHYDSILESELDKMGTEGWELVSVESLKFQNGYELIFKRIISNEEFIYR